jgi:hypothetical protein
LKIKLFCFFMLLTLLLPLKTFAAASSPSPSPISITNSAYQQQSQLDAYKMLYENSKTYNDRMLNLIYWFIGAVLTLILFFIGSNIFTNRRIRKDESATLIRNFETQLIEIKKVAIIDIEKSINEKINGTINGLALKIESLNKEFTDKYLHIMETQTQQNKVTSDAYNTQISAMKTLYNQKFSGIEKMYKELGAQVTEQNNNNTKLIENIKQRLSAEIYYINANISFIQKVYSNALRDYCNTTILRLNLNMALVDSSIEKIIKTMELMNSIASYDHTTVTKLITKLPSPEYDINKERIILLLKALPVK